MTSNWFLNSHIFTQTNIQIAKEKKYAEQPEPESESEPPEQQQ